MNSTDPPPGGHADQEGALLGGERQVGDVVATREQRERVMVVRDIGAAIETPAIAEVLLEVSAEGITAGGCTLIDFRDKLAVGRLERGVIEGRRLGRIHDTAVVTACQVIAAAGQRNVTVELVPVIDALEVDLHLAGFGNGD